MRTLTFSPLPTCGFIELRGARFPLVHPAHRYREAGRALIRDCFQLHESDFAEGPRPPSVPFKHDDDLPDPGATDLP